MKRIAVFFAVILLLAAAAVIAGPSLVDWNAYRDDVARAIGDATGRRVAIDGDLDLAILPTPHLSAGRFRMANVEGAAEPDMLRVSKLRLNLAVAPLFRGVLEFTSITLVEPVIALERTAQGRASWDFARPQEGDAGAGPRTATGQRVVEVSVRHVAITNGTVTWRDAGGEPERLRNLDAAIAANGVSGGYRIDGKAAYRDVPFALDGSVGRIGKDEPVPVNATVALPDGAATLVAMLQADLSAGSASGTVRLTAPDAARMVRAIDVAAPASLPAQPLAVEAALQATRQTLGLTDLKLRLGETAGQGKAELRLDGGPSIVAEIGFPVLDLDALIAAMQKAGAPAETTTEAPLAPPGPSALPDRFAVKADLTADTVRLRGGLVRDARLSARLEKGILHLTSAAARLPGGTDLSLSGRTTSEAGGIGFTGELAAAADNLRAALVWAGVDDKAIPADRLRGFSCTSRVMVAPDTVQLTDITARLDATRMTGGVTVARRARPSFGLRLSLDRLNLDDYLPQLASRDGTAAAGNGGNQTGSPLFDSFDANFDISVDSLTWRGETARTVRLDGKILKGDATLTSATAVDIAGAAVKASGRIAHLSASPAADLDIAVDGRDPERFGRLVGIADGATARRFGRFRIDGHVAGTLMRADVKGTLAALGGSISASGSISDPRGKPAYDLSFTLGDPDGRRLLTLVAPEPNWGDIGPVSGRFGVKGDSDGMAVRNLDIAIGGMPLSGTVDAGFTGARPKVSANLTAGHLALDRFLPGAATGGEGPAAQAVRGSARWSRERVDLSSMRKTDLDLSLKLASLQRRDIRIDDADIHAGLTGGLLTLDRFVGTAFGGRVAVTGSVDTTGATPLVDARIDGTDLEAHTAFGALLGFDRLQGPVTVGMAVRTSGESEFALVSALSGIAKVAGSVTARLTKEERTKAGVAGLVGTLLGRKVKEAGFASDALVSLLQSFADAPAALSGDATIENGRARTENLALDGKGARAITVGTANLPDWTIDSRTTLRRDIDAGGDPYMVISLKGPLDDPDVGTSGTWLRGPAAAPTTPVETQPAPEVPALQPEQPAPEAPEKIDPKQLFLELLKKRLQK